MKETPLLFSAPMIRALMAGTKTQTRRIMKHQPTVAVEQDGWPPEIALLASGEWGVCHGGVVHESLGKCPWGGAGDRIWCRETWRVASHHDSTRPSDLKARKMNVSYEAGGFACNTSEGWHVFTGEQPDVRFGRLRPSIFIPRWASRLTLELTAVRVERVQEISPEDCRAEGMPDKNTDVGVRYCYGKLWNKLNEKRELGWDVNPWVWCLSFRRLTP